MKKKWFYHGHRSVVCKILIKMKLIILFLCLSFLGTWAIDSYSQTTKISLNIEDSSIKRILNLIEEQSEYRFFYSGDVDVEKKTSIIIEDKSITEILDRLFTESNVRYRISGRQIALFYEGSKDGFDTSVQQKPISGKVVDGKGMVLPGVTVLIKGTMKGTITDSEGNFKLSGVTGDAILVFSFVGMKTQEIEVTNQTSFNIVMEEDAIGIEEVVAIGYGTMRKRDLTGAIVSISSKDIEKQTASNLTQILRGGMSGVQVGLSTSPKGTSNILIRGKTSLKASNNPLIVLDGIVFTGDMADINVTDIESINILKDASSAAVYGASAAGGVILIETKRGKKGKPIITFNTNIGFSTVADIQELRDPESYLIERIDFFERQFPDKELGYYQRPSDLPPGLSLDEWRNYDGNSDLTDDEIWMSRIKLNDTEQENYLANRTVDWYDEVFQIGLRQDYTVGITGASDDIAYYVSLGYVNNEGFIVGQGYENIRARANLETRVTNYLKIGLNSQFSSRDESPLSASGTSARGASPYGSIYNKDGTYKLYPHDDVALTNPFYYNYSDRYRVNKELLGNIYADLNLPFGFSYRMNWINRIRSDQNYSFSYSTDERTGSGGSRSDGHGNKWAFENILKWGKTIADKHKFDLTFLYRTEKSSSWRGVASNSNFVPNELLGYHNLSFGSDPNISNNDVIFTADALMGRLNYSLSDKYLFSALYRRDGSSVFGANNSRAGFPSVSFGWVISQEDFFDIEWIDFLKLRTSWGINGNNSIQNYLALAVLNSTKYIYNTESGKKTFSGYWAKRMANNNLQWEETEALNGGVDFSLFGNRLSGAVELYYMSTNNLILDRSLPTITGYQSITTNLGEVVNRGGEFTINSRNVNNNNFQWGSSFAISMNKNEIKHLYGTMEDILDKDGNVIGQKEADDIANSWFIGESIDVIYDYTVEGIWQIGEETEAMKYGVEPGDLKIKDLNDDGLIDRKDKDFIGHRSPRANLFLRNDFTLFKNIDISLNLLAQIGYLGRNNHHIHTGWQYGRFNQFEYPYWTPENPTNKWARLGSNNPYGANYYVSRSFVKVQNLSVGYNFPERLVKSLKVNGLRLMFNIENAYTFAPSWNFFDAETSSAAPMIGTFSATIKL